VLLTLASSVHDRQKADKKLLHCDLGSAGPKPTDPDFSSTPYDSPGSFANLAAMHRASSAWKTRFY
jgi:hypothetical protein